MLILIFCSMQDTLASGEKAPEISEEETYVFPIQAAISASLISCSSSLAFLTDTPWSGTHPSPELTNWYSFVDA